MFTLPFSDDAPLPPPSDVPAPALPESLGARRGRRFTAVPQGPTALVLEAIVQEPGQAGQTGQAVASTEADEALARQLVEVASGGTSEHAELPGRLAVLQSEATATLARRAGFEGPGFRLAVGRIGTVFAAAHALAAGRLVTERAEELELIACTDALTGLGNVRFLRMHMEELIARQRRYGQGFGVLVVDVDGFKRINDSFGHSEGDRMLVEIAAAMSASIRTEGTAVRIGGDEFCVLAPAGITAELRVLAQRLLLASRRVKAPDGRSVRLSVGIATCPRHGVGADRLLHAADRAMYRAKGLGGGTAVSIPSDLAPASEKLAR